MGYSRMLDADIFAAADYADGVAAGSRSRDVKEPTTTSETDKVEIHAGGASHDRSVTVDGKKLTCVTKVEVTMASVGHPIVVLTLAPKELCVDLADAEITTRSDS